VRRQKIEINFFNLLKKHGKLFRPSNHLRAELQEKEKKSKEIRDPFLKIHTKKEKELLLYP
jgi:hypothetical protein